MEGHLSKECWFMESNKNKQPAFFNKIIKKNCENSVKVEDGITSNFLLSTIVEVRWTSESELWIAETAATVHMTSYCTVFSKI
jgi:hypothetical protein